jgi:4-hydroxybenzoate polyprenyltransferase
MHQWVKNTLLFVPLFVGHAFMAHAFASIAQGFVLLSLLSSATYIINDLADLEADREHPTKRLRPFASGRLDPRRGWIAAPVMIVVVLAGAYLLIPAFAASLFAYLALTLGYSFG